MEAVKVILQMLLNGCWVNNRLNHYVAQNGRYYLSGAEHRKAQNYAEVQLRLDNHSKKLSVDENEVIVTRRLYRSGESEYYINNDRARLKDIADLFLDSGLGKKHIALSRKVEWMKY